MKAAKTATERARELIQELGYAVKDPPTDWRKDLERKLAAEGFALNQSALHKARKKLVEEGAARRSGEPKAEAVPVKEAGGPAVRLSEYERAWASVQDSGLTLGDFAKINALAWKLAGHGQDIDDGYLKLQGVIADLRTLESFKL